MSNPDPICKNCKFWQDYESRVYVVIRDKDAAKMGAGLVALGDGFAEARPCRYRANPTVQQSVTQPYTGENYTCEDWRQTG